MYHSEQEKSVIMEKNKNKEEVREEREHEAVLSKIYNWDSRFS